MEYVLQRQRPRALSQLDWGPVAETLAMSEPRVVIRFDGNGRVYRSGESLAGEYRLTSMDAGQIKAIEISILWSSQGKGDDDMAVHDFQRLSVENGDVITPRVPGRFSTILPNSPVTYEGRIVKLRWCARVRVFMTDSREVVGELPFRLGDVSAAKTAQM